MSRPAQSSGSDTTQDPPTSTPVTMLNKGHEGDTGSEQASGRKFLQAHDLTGNQSPIPEEMLSHDTNALDDMVVESINDLPPTSNNAQTEIEAGGPALENSPPRLPNGPAAASSGHGSLHVIKQTSTPPGIPLSPGRIRGISVGFMENRKHQNEKDMAASPSFHTGRQRSITQIPEYSDPRPSPGGPAAAKPGQDVWHMEARTEQVIRDFVNMNMDVEEPKRASSSSRGEADAREGGTVFGRVASMMHITRNSSDSFKRRKNGGASDDKGELAVQQHITRSAGLWKRMSGARIATNIVKALKPRLTNRQKWKRAVMKIQVGRALKIQKKHNVDTNGETPNELWFLPLIPHRWLISADNKWKSRWDWFTILLVMYTCIFIPLDFAFPDLSREMSYDDADHVATADPIFILNSLVDLLFLVDLVLSFCHCYTNTYGDDVRDRVQIRNHYLRGMFTVDLLGTLPLDECVSILAPGVPLEVLGLFKLPRLLRVGRLMKKLDSLAAANFLRIVRLLVGFSAFSHWIACFWYYIGRNQRTGNRYLGPVWLVLANLCQTTVRLHSEDPNSEWVDYMAERQLACVPDSHPDHLPRGSSDYSDADISTTYITSLYWAFTTLTTVGYGDISPGTNTEMAFTAVVFLMGAIVYATIFGNIAALIAGYDQEAMRYQEKISNLKELTALYELNPSMCNRLVKYLHRHHAYTHELDHEAILGHLPPTFRSDVEMEMHKAVVKQLIYTCPTLEGHQVFLRALVLTLHCQVLLENDEVLCTGDLRQQALYFVNHGAVLAIPQRHAHLDTPDLDTIVLPVFKDGEFFVTKEVIGFPVLVTFRAAANCRLHTVSIAHYQVLVAAFPEQCGLLKSYFLKKLDEASSQNRAIGRNQTPSPDLAKPFAEAPTPPLPAAPAPADPTSAAEPAPAPAHESPGQLPGQVPRAERKSGGAMAAQAAQTELHTSLAAAARLSHCDSSQEMLANIQSDQLSVSDVSASDASLLAENPKSQAYHQQQHRSRHHTVPRLTSMIRQTGEGPIVEVGGEDDRGGREDDTDAVNESLPETQRSSTVGELTPRGSGSFQRLKAAPPSAHRGSVSVDSDQLTALLHHIDSRLDKIQAEVNRNSQALRPSMAGGGGGGEIAAAPGMSEAARASPLPAPPPAPAPFDALGVSSAALSDSLTREIYNPKVRRRRSVISGAVDVDPAHSPQHR